MSKSALEVAANAMPFDALAAAEYVSIESYRRDGDAARTPVWIVQEAGLLYCWTMLSSGKVKRIRRNSKVRLAACDARGKIRGDWVEANARVLDSDAEIKAQAKRMRRKYGLKFLPFRVLPALRGKSSVAIVFAPPDAN